MTPTTANSFATIAILAWPIVAILLYSTRSPSEATLWTILGGLLLLPSNYGLKIQMVPAFDKNSIPNLCALIGCLIVFQDQRHPRPAFGVADILAVMFVAGPALSSIYNNDTLVYGDRILPGVGIYDGLSAVLGQFLFLLPFFIGRRYFQRSADTEMILRVLVIAGLAYSLLLLFEVRMSPKLSIWIYGFFPSGMNSEMRDGGFRPVAFMSNGLSASFFMVTSFLAAVTLSRAKLRIKPFPSDAVPVYLAIVIILCKSAGSFIYAIVVGLVIRFIRSRRQLQIAALLVSVGLLYPVLRATNHFPDELFLSAAESLSHERALSLQTRFEQEQQLVAHASQRLLFGWGRYGRSRVYDDLGKDITLTDGGWIITLGQFGIVGFIGEFGLLALSVFRGVLAAKYASTSYDRILIAALSLIVALTVVEQLPNSSITPWSMLLAGALLGSAEYFKSRARLLRRSKPFSREDHTNQSAKPIQ